MREVVFRGKRIDNGEWVEGSYCHAEKLDRSGDEHFIIEYSANGSSHRVDPETVNQYTGLKDKNGKRIFEGDIVQYYERQIGGEYAPIVQPVGFEEGGFGVYRYFLNNWLRDAINGNILLEEIEVIGNIHDNQELLEIK